MKKKLVAMLLVLAIGVALLPGVTISTHATEPVSLENATDLSAWAAGGYTDLEIKALTINDEEDFKQFQIALSTNNKTFEGYTVYLMADIDLNPHWNSNVALNWDENGALTSDAVQKATGTGTNGYVLPGTNSTGKIFNGTFDGMGHSISGLYLSQNGANVASLFGKTTGTATAVKNLVVLDSFFLNGKVDSNATSQASVKPLAGLFTIVEAGANATISNCYIDVDLYDGQPAYSSSAAGFNSKVGGLVGYCVGSVTIKDTVYAGSISNNLTTTTKQSGNEVATKEKWRIGGAVGQVMGSTTANASVTMENYVFAGTIYHEDKGTSGAIGYCAYADIDMTNCLCFGRQYGSAEITAFAAAINRESTLDVTITDSYKNGSYSVVSLAGKLTGNWSVNVSQNGSDYVRSDNATGAMTTTGTPKGYDVKATNAATLAIAINNNNGTLGDVFADVDGALVPKALYEMYKPDAPVVNASFVSAAYDKDVTAAELRVEATGNGTLSYQWYCGENAVEGATQATFIPDTATSGNFAYSCEVTVSSTNFLGTIAATAKTEAVTIHVHDWNPGTCTSPKTCNVPECPTIVEAVDHAFDDDCTTADKCANCDEVAEAKESHTFDTDCTTADKCANCETKATAVDAHTYTDDHDTGCNADGCTVTREAIHTEGDVWNSDETGHWHICTGCDYAFPVVGHTDSTTDEDVLCDECGYDVSCQHVNLTKVDGFDATCTQEGKLTHWKCNKCGALLDAEVNGKVITDVDTVIPAWHSDISKKYSSDGTNHWKVCNACKAKLYISAHTYSSATDTKCDCGHKRELVSLDSVITVSQWVKDGKSADVKAVKIADVADFKAFMKELVSGTTAVLNSSYAVRTDGDIAFDGMTIYLTADLELNEGWTNDFNLKWNSTTGKLGGKTDVTVPKTKYNPSGQRIFGGMFDGQDHTISGLFIDKQKNAAAQSLLGVAHSKSGFTVGVQNLTIKNSYIEGTNPGMGALFTGVTAGTNVLIANCNIDVDLVSRYEGKDKTSVYVGGLIGAVAGNVTIDSTKYTGSIWAENQNNLQYREVGGAIGIVKGGTDTSTGTNVMINDFTFNGKIYWLNGQRIGAFIGRIENQTNVSMVDSTSKGKIVVMAGGYTGGLCNNIVGAAANTTTNVVIDNCYYVPGYVFNEGALVEQTLIYNVIHSGKAEKTYGGFGKDATADTAKGTCVVYIISDRGTGWSENLCLYQSLPNADTGDAQGMFLGFMVAMLLVSAMALVILIPKRSWKK